VDEPIEWMNPAAGNPHIRIAGGFFVESGCLSGICWWDFYYLYQ